MATVVVIKAILANKSSKEITDAVSALFTDPPQVKPASAEQHGKAFLNFDTLEAATRAVALLNGNQLFGKTIVANLQGARAIPAPPQPPAKYPGNQTVIVSPIPLGSTSQAILDDIRAYGCQCTYVSAVSPIGKVYINFESADAALDAVNFLKGRMVLGNAVTAVIKDPSSAQSAKIHTHVPVPPPGPKVPDAFRFAMGQLHKAEKFHGKKLSIARNRLSREIAAPPSFNGSANQTQKEMINVFKIAVCELISQQNFFKDVKMRIIDQFEESSKQHSDIAETKYRLFREAYRLNEALPALALRGIIEDKITAGKFVIIQGATGSGYVLPIYTPSVHFTSFCTDLC